MIIEAILIIIVMVGLDGHDADLSVYFQIWYKGH